MFYPHMAKIVKTQHHAYYRCILDTPQSPSVHVRQGLYPDDRKTLTESLLRQVSIGSFRHK